MNSDKRPRRIETVEDVVKVLRSPKASLVELIDCVKVARDNRQTDLRHEAAERALAIALCATTQRLPLVKEAAHEVFLAFFARPTTLDEVEDAAAHAATWLMEVGASLPIEFVTKKKSALNELLLYFNDGTPMMLTKVSKLLRKYSCFDRPDLAVLAAGRALRDEPDNHAALVTRAAGLADLRRYEESSSDYGRVISSDPENTYALVVKSRVLRETGRLDEALQVARRAWELEENRSTANNLIASAAAVGDETTLEEIINQIESSLLVEDETDRWVVVLAAEELFIEGERNLDMKRVNQAKAMIAKLLGEPMNTPLRKRCQDLMSRIKRFIRDLQGRFDIG